MNKTVTSHNYISIHHLSGTKQTFLRNKRSIQNKKLTKIDQYESCNFKEQHHPIRTHATSKQNATAAN